MSLSGQGIDVTWSITGSYTGFGNLVSKGQKHSNKAKKKMLMNANGTTVGYKYYDFYEEASIDGWIGSGIANTGTVTPLSASVGSTVTIAGALEGGLNGNWSLDSFDFNGQVEEVLGCTLTITRYASVPVV